MFEQIEKFYQDNHFRLIEDRSDGSLRPGKSFTKDVENCISKFKSFYESEQLLAFSEDRLQDIIGAVDTNTRSQNLRVMREFNFMFFNGNNSEYEFTTEFIDFVNSGMFCMMFIVWMIFQCILIY